MGGRDGPTEMRGQKTPPEEVVFSHHLQETGGEMI